MVKKRTGFDNDGWIKDNFEMIVDRYGGRFPYVLVVSGHIFPVKSSKELPKLEKRLRREYGPPVGLPVPQRRDFISVLSARRLRA